MSTHQLTDKAFREKFPQATFISQTEAKVQDGNKIYFWQWNGKVWWNVEERTTFTNSK